MEELTASLGEYFNLARLMQGVRAALILALGLVAARVVGRALAAVFSRRGSPQQVLLARRVVSWLITGLTIVTALDHLGFDLSVLLGAAGVLTVAVGFASQTSASNLISGLFLIVERPFVVGDVITVNGRTGVVVSVDLLSVKLRTFDNLLVRIPNESLLKGEIVNITHYPIRRIDLKLGVSYRSDLKNVSDTLLAVADGDPGCFEEPKPLIIFEAFGDNAINLQFSVWVTKEQFLDVRNRLYQEIKRRFDELGIEIPFPQRTLSTIGGAALPVQIVQGVEGEHRT
jgi:small-conductance mechanosensitive channel